MRTAAIVGVMIATSVAVFAQQPAADPKASARFGALRSEQQKDPYGNLFKAQEELKKAVGQVRIIRPKTRIVCGMTMIEGDSMIDPKIAVTPKKQDNLDHKIRAIEPPVCNPAK